MAKIPIDPKHQELVSQLIAKAWSDEAFKERLLAEPSAVLKEQGVHIPEGIDIRLLENTDQVTHFVLPAKPADELSEEQLDQAAGGYSQGTGASGIASEICYCEGIEDYE